MSAVSVYHRVVQQRFRPSGLPPKTPAFWQLDADAQRIARRFLSGDRRVALEIRQSARPELLAVLVASHCPEQVDRRELAMYLDELELDEHRHAHAG